MLKIKDLPAATFAGWESHNPEPLKQKYKEEDMEMPVGSTQEEELQEYVCIEEVDLTQQPAFPAPASTSDSSLHPQPLR